MGYYIRVLARSKGPVPVTRLEKRLRDDGIAARLDVMECIKESGKGWNWFTWRRMLLPTDALP
jgi:hypothetical protein